MKKLMAAVLAGLMLAGLLSGCASTANDEKVEYRWKMALNSTEGDNAYDTGVLFAQKIKELTDGRVQVDLYGGAQLGTTAEVLEGMYAGVADVMCESIGTLATFTPLANIEAMPYMFSSYDHFMNVWYSDLGQEIKDAVGDDAGLRSIPEAADKMETALFDSVHKRTGKSHQFAHILWKVFLPRRIQILRIVHGKYFLI